MAKRDDNDYRVPPSEADLFTDREEFLEAFEVALTELTPDAPKVLVFYGPAGIGKSAIKRKLTKDLKADEYPGAYAWGEVELDKNLGDEPEKAMAILASSIEDCVFPSFETAAALYWQKKYPYIKFNENNAPDFRWGGIFFRIAGAIGVPVAEALAPGAGPTVAAAAGLGALTASTLDASQGPIKQAFKKRMAAGGETELSNLKSDDRHIVLKKLPKFLGEDLTLFTERKNKIVLFLDNYEKMWLSEIEMWASTDEWVRTLVESSPGVLFVIGCRKPLPWGKGSKVDIEYWRGMTTQDEVPDLEDGYLTDMLSEAGIEEEGIVKRIIKLSEGVPFYTWLSIDYYYDTIKRVDIIRPDDFPETREEMYESFMKGLEIAERAALETISCARKFDYELFDILITQFRIPYPVGKFIRLTEYSFFIKHTKRIPGDEETEISEEDEETKKIAQFSIHELFTRHIQKPDQFAPNLYKEVHTFLYEHYKAIAEVNDPKAITEENLAALGEALYHGLQSGRAEGVMDWFNGAHQVYRIAAMYAEMSSLYEWLLEKIEEDLGEENTTFATTLNNLAALSESQDRYDEAEPLYQRSLEIFEKALDPDHPDVAATLNNLALLYKARGRYDEAEPYYKRALEIREEKQWPDDPDVAQSLNNLAALYKAQGRYDKAEPLYQRSLEIKEKALGPEHPDVAATLNNLAELYRAQDRYDEAEPYYKRALGIVKESLGSDHPYVATTLNNLAGLYYTQGRYQYAEPLCVRALRINEEKLGSDHLEVAFTLNNLAALYTAQDRYVDAEPLYERALNIREEKLGPDHPDIAATLNNLGVLYYYIEDKIKAVEYLEKALVIYEKVLPENHPEIIGALKSLSAINNETGQPEKAAEYKRRAEELQASREEGE